MTDHLVISPEGSSSMNILGLSSVEAGSAASQEASLSQGIHLGYVRHGTDPDRDSTTEEYGLISNAARLGSDPIDIVENPESSYDSPELRLQIRDCSSIEEEKKFSGGGE